MSDSTPVDIHDVEQNLQPVPETARTTNVSAQFWIWCGANIAPINWVLGALGVNLGLGLWDTVTVLVLGNLIGMSLFGLFVLLGQRTGATGMVLSRGPFGRVGNYLPSAIQACLAIGWCSINTWIILDLVMALFGELGLIEDTESRGLRVAVAAVIMAIQVAISWLGYKAISAFERWTVPPTIVILVLMSVVAWFFLDIDWSYAGPAGQELSGGDRLAAMTAVMTAIGIGWGITWFTYAADYSRFVSRSVRPRRLYVASTLGQFIPVVWLGLLGATLATKSGEVDPGQLIVENYGALALPVLLLVVHGPIATNILNIYTFSVATQAMDIRIPRRTLSVLVGALAMLAVVWFVYNGDFAQTLDAFLVGIVAWVATWGAIILVHYHRVIPSISLESDYLFAPVGTTRLPAVNWAGLTAFGAGVVMTWLCMYGLVPEMQGPIAKAMGGVDLSWLAGGVTGAVVYAVLGPIAFRPYQDAADGDGARPGRAAQTPEGRV